MATLAMHRKGDFQTTKWSVVLSARAGGQAGSEEALGQLCEIYWYPLYVFVRRSGRQADEALDLTQGYFLRLMEADYLKNVRPEAGRFRSFLLSSMKHYMANRRRESLALKRGGRRQIVSLDADDAENRYRLEPRDDRTPEKAYEHQWARAVIQRAYDRLRIELDDAGKPDHYRLLAPFLSGGLAAGPCEEAAEQLGSTAAAVRMAVTRMRRRFGNILREEVSRTVDEERDVDDEVRHLRSALT
jgi:RNA polymerase sigma factor (sigma-70 family)